MRAEPSTLSFGALLRHHRLAAQLTQEELAERAGISARSVSDIERGISRAPQKATVRFLAEALRLADEEREIFEGAARASRRAIVPLHRQEAGEPALLYSNGAVSERRGFQVRRLAWAVAGLAAVSVIALAVLVSRSSPRGSSTSSHLQPWGWTSASLQGWEQSQTPSTAPTQFDHPANVAVDGRGNVYVADALGNSITKLSPDGRLLARWGSPGTGRGQLDFPTGLAVNRSGEIYVADTSNNRIQKLSPQGKWLAWWGMPGSSLANLSGPTGVTVDRRGNVYIADGDSAEVIKLSASGRVLARWSPRQFEDPENLAAAPDGTVYVADSAAGTIDCLSPAGRMLTSWHLPGFIPGQYTFPTGYPVGVAVDSHGAVYVTDTYRDRILKLSRSGRVQATWGGPGSGPGRFDVPLGIAVDRSGAVYVGDRNNHRVQKLSSAGVPLPAWGAVPPPASRFPSPIALAADRAAHVYILEATTPPRVQELSPQGLPIRDVILHPVRQADALSGLALDTAGNLYAADPVHNRVLMFGPTGELRATWGTEGMGGGQFHDPTDVAVAPSGTVYVADSDNSRIQAFSPHGRVLRTTDVAGYPQSVTVDVHGNVYTADVVRGDVTELSPAGTFLRVLGIRRASSIRWKKPVALAVSRSGDVYVADAGSKQVVEISRSGRVLRRWGGKGISARLADVVVDPMGNVFALDAGSGHVVKLT
jgi:DNA-binding beta-propeller fold protein YncE/transcriptional regulator with XRE-family HTH domain